ncbi:MAG: hypothetical protein ABFD44_07750, partial [Anaerolineaceae bacterium]
FQQSCIDRGSYGIRARSPIFLPDDQQIAMRVFEDKAVRLPRQIRCLHTARLLYRTFVIKSMKIIETDREYHQASLPTVNIPSRSF